MFTHKDRHNDHWKYILISKLSNLEMIITYFIDLFQD